MASLDLPYRCPRCGEHKRFRSLSSLRAHLEYNHTYETLYVLSKSNSVCDAAALLPLVAEGALLAPANNNDPFEPLRSSALKERRFPCRELPCVDDLSLTPANSNTAARYIPNVEFPLGDIFMKTAMTSTDSGPHGNPSTAVAVAANVAASAVEAAYEEGLARLKARAFERLELDERLEKLSEEVEQKIAARVGRLQSELERKSSELERAKLESERLSQEKQDLEDKASELSRQVDVSVEMLANLKQDLVNKEAELNHKQQEVAQIDQFLQETAAREANAKVRLQQFIEELLDRADRAEKQLQIISSCGTTPNGSLGRCSLQASKGNGRQRNSSLSGSTRGMYQVSDRRSSPSTGASGRIKSVSQGSGGYDSDSVEMHPMEDCPEAQYYHMQCRLGEGYERSPGCGSRNWGLRKQAIQNWQRRPYRNSTEGEEGDVSDVGSRTTESEMEMWEQDRRAVAEVQQSAAPYPHHGRAGYRPNIGRSEGVYGKPCRYEKSPSRSNEVISPEILKMRAALFCIFTYLDTKTLLRAAEVCRDWKFVARHPAVWTRVLLENARISSKFLSTVSQWCTQTHSLILQNLKPRQRGKKETKEDYLKSTRGCLEEGLEALLKATGSNLLILKISHCPNLLTDRSLWLASCYCRALQAVTYRSATDPVGQEVIWALGAGCRDIISLQVAPLHPCQQPARFSNRCLQTIGRCWPHLRALGVGGAGCGIQGLASLARNCMRLQVLELDHVSEINQEVAAEVCREGLKGLEMLVLTSTPVTPKALLHFNSVCRNLKSIVVQIGIEDYFEDPNSPEARKLFDEMVNKLQALKKRPGFSKILHVKADSLC
ncbi:F-box only protein 41 [Hippoglossus hippoglossus]|uniref:F-box only protein 41 n=1 Tax=Hippoglossus hippoglossus TaxID=8267 RepID=UPI00148D021E|nr:F-box only protein 41 [Hippoglossus hippoglossus]XP_034439555.1 F-box only protein 41 [Hippoglossus hippoglossus]XP_034439564.1 F-box only protein 41 [Hippoglossus hippoglossus]XP_034439571.1 F-box only protein 41 [Hippoglossus hippoglossus]XP_035031520.1 F-box only protein 41 [Hippoglossus stenolepis]